MNTANIVEIYCIFDEFCLIFEPELKKRLIDTSGKRRRNRKSRVSDAEIMTMLVLLTMKTQPFYSIKQTRKHQTRLTLPRFVGTIGLEPMTSAM